MNKIYSVSYDLRGPHGDYAGMFEELQKSPSCCHCLESTWLVRTTETAQQVYNRLRRHLHPNDMVLVTQIEREYSGWMRESVWDWIASNL